MAALGSISDQVRLFLGPDEFDDEVLGACARVERDLPEGTPIRGALRATRNESRCLVLLTEHDLRVYPCVEGGSQVTVPFWKIVGSSVAPRVLTIHASDRDMEFLLAEDADVVADPLASFREALIALAPQAAGGALARRRAATVQLRALSEAASGLLDLGRSSRGLLLRRPWMLTPRPASADSGPWASARANG
jgi:hypothetical protein